MKKILQVLVVVICLLALQLAMLGLYSLGGWDLMFAATVLITAFAAVAVPNLVL